MMKAVGYTHSLAIENPESLQDLELETPSYGEHDLLVRVNAISVNPVDTKVRKNRAPGGIPEILGWDAVGIVEAIGPLVTGFKPGERVFYAGAINRAGCNSELHAVDARLVAHAPASLNNLHAAALPLTAITAWEILFDRLAVPQGGGAGKTLLITAAAGGVGSILIQLARQLTQLTIVATASRPESADWVKQLGAHVVIDHHQAWSPQLALAGLSEVNMLASLSHTPQHFEQMVEILAPQGKLALIDDFDALPIMKLKAKSISLHWEMMFTRSMFQTSDMDRQGALLAEVARLVDEGRLRSTFGRQMGTIDATNLRAAHAFIESGKAVGKVVLADWS
jgi:zinc-binding alcohol dehydrogenase family protein